MTSDYWTTIGEIAEVFDGPHATPKKTDKGPIFLGIGSLNNGKLDLSRSEHLSEEDFSKWTKRVTPKAGDVVFSYETRLGEASIIPAGLRCCLGRRMGLLRPKLNRVLPDYLLYSYLGPDLQNLISTRTIHGSTVDRIALRDLPNFPIQIPPLAEQKSVIDVLKSLDSKIELNRKINQTLEDIARAIFKSWFVDFEPVKAKIEAKANGQDPERAAMCAISGKSDDELGRLPVEQLARIRDTAALFPDELVDSELGFIPRGWLHAFLGDFVDFQNGYAFKSKDWAKEGFPVVKIGSVKPGFVDLDSCSYVAEDTVAGLDRFILLPGDILVGMTGYPGETGLVPHCETKVYLNQRVGKLGVENGNHGFVFCAVRNERFKSFVELQAHGSAQANVSSKAILAFPLVDPGKDLIDCVEQLIQPAIQKMLMFESETKTLAQLRDALLPKLLSGEIDLQQMAV